MPRSMRRPVAAFAVLTLAACSTAVRRPALAAPDGLRVLRAELTASDSELSAAASADVRALDSRVTDDVFFLSDGLGIVRGRGTLSTTLDSLAGHSLARLRWSAVRTDVSADGGSGYTLGYGTREGSEGAAPVRYIAFWRKSGSGDWRVAALAIARGSDASLTTAPRGCETPTADHAAAYPVRSTHRQGAPVIDADARFAARAAIAGPGPAFLAFIAPDGVVLGGAGPIGCGPAALEHAFDGSGPGDLTWQPRGGFLAAGGDLGFSVGIARVRGATGSATSKYLTIWKRQPDGQWRFVADGGNAAPPGA